MHSNIEEINALRWHKFPVLDDGFVCLVDCMGDDDDIAEAARVSYGSEARSPDANKTLIRSLMRRRHTSPFEQAELKFLVRVPLFVWQQWLRHRTANINAESHRYKKLDPPQFHKVAADEWRLQSTTDKQGSEGVLPPQLGKVLSERQNIQQYHDGESYKSLIDNGVAREQARIDLPVSTYTEAYFKIDLHNCLHLLQLRMDETAQREIRVYAEAIAQIVERLFPATWAAFRDYRLEAVTLSALDIRVVQATKYITTPLSLSEFEYAVRESGVQWGNREESECLAKLQWLGLVAEVDNA